MEKSTVARLAELNRRFYEDHAADFADTRPRLAPGVRRVLAGVPAGARVLEVGCGDGKVGRALKGVDYVGVDQSAALLERARVFSARHAPERALRFVQADLLADELPGGPFDWILALAVFHHLPGAQTRAHVLRQLAARLAPGGTFAMSNWQFHTSARLLGRRVPWAAAGLAAPDVEPGDALLAWERSGRRGLRYAHALAEPEALALAAAAGLTVLETFRADGASGDLAHYLIARRDASPNSQPPPLGPFLGKL